MKILRTGFVALILGFAANPMLAQDINGSSLNLTGMITQNGIGTNFLNAGMSSFNGSACFGNACASTGESNGTANPPLRLKWSQTDILFEDSSTSSFPNRDWRIRINDSSGLERFSIRDEGEDWTAATPVTPFTIVGGAPENAFWIADTGRIGLGTSLPQDELHILSTDIPTIRMEQQSPSFGNQTYSLAANENGLFVIDVSASTQPFAVRAGAPDNALRVVANGNVGIGTGNPGAPLTVSSADTFSFFRIEARGAPTNTSADMTFTGGPLGTGEYRINVVDGDGPEMRVDAEGFVTATTGFKVGGATLTVPDYVFEPGYALRPLSEVEDFILQNGHLPGVPSVADVARDGLDVTAQQMIHLEKIEELTLHSIAQQKTIRDQEARIARLEAALDALAELAAR